MKNLVFVSVLSLVLFSCKNPELEKHQAALKEATCRMELSKRVSDSHNTIALAVELGMQKDLEAFQKLQQDSTITCDSLESAWTSFTDKLHKKSDLKIK